MPGWIIVSDADRTNLKTASHVLRKNGMRVSTVTSGHALLDCMNENGTPDLILLDMKMSDMDGFETLKKLRELEGGKSEIPVIFLTAEEDEESETRALQLGAVDYIRKPFEPEVLVSRVRRILDMQDKMHRYERDAQIDSLTGCLNKSAAEAKMEKLCREETGFLCMLDLDSFKLVNDLCGHDTGDRILRLFARNLRKNIRSDDVCGRIGGDEFLIFARNMKTEDELHSLYRRISDDFTAGYTEILGNRMEIPLGVSLGAAAVPRQGRNYSTVFRLADQALASVKSNGKHGWELSGRNAADVDEPTKGMDLESMTTVLEERNISHNAMWMGRDAFISIYRYMVRYMERYHGMAYRVLFTIKTNDESHLNSRAILIQFRQLVQHSLRNSDVMMEVGDDQLFLLLPEAHDYDINRVVSRLLKQWEKTELGNLAIISYETGRVHLNRNDPAAAAGSGCHVAVVDDDEVDLKTAENILSKERIQVSTMKSGEALLDYLESNKPDLILLDIRMPELDGFETMRRLKAQMKPDSDIPVIFLADDENQETEIEALHLGAMELIRKPLIPELLTLRVRHTIELVRLQRNLYDEVNKKTRENQTLSLRVVQTLAEAIDAKNAYTDGHSGRVAKYAREIARRAGYDIDRQDSVYLIGLLHDVGMIGVADFIINKPGRLTVEEYDAVKTHPVTGARILRNIQERPELAVGARWHHERYDGSGYPDGLAGKQIPEAARIIAVADAYDAMTSRRSYRGALTQEAVRKEIEKGRGTQFDPEFADIVLGMIAEDPDYLMRELAEAP